MEQLCKSEVGSFSTPAWRDVDEILFSLSRQNASSSNMHDNSNADENGNDNYSNSNAHSPANVKQAFRLLNRMAEEPTTGLKDPIRALNVIILYWKTGIQLQLKQQGEQHYHDQQRHQQPSNHDNTKQQQLRSRTRRHHHNDSLAVLRSMPSPAQVLSMLKSMQQKSQNTYQPDHATYTMILEVLAMLQRYDTHFANKAKRIELAMKILSHIIEESKQNPLVQPTPHGFAAVMSCWIHGNSRSTSSSSSPLPSSVSKEIDALYQMVEQLHGAGWSEMQPNATLFNLRLKAHVMDGQVEHAETILSEQLHKAQNDGSEFQPDCISFTTVLDGYANYSNDNNSANEKTRGEKAEFLLSTMQSLYENGNDLVKPNLVTYTSVVKAWLQDGNLSRAEEILHLLEKYAAEDHELQPDVVLYNTILHGYVRAGQAQKAQDLLSSMLDEQSGVQPSERSFAMVISAWAKQGRTDNAESVLLLMHKLHVDGSLASGPNIVAYNAVIDAWAKCDDDEGWKRAQHVFYHVLQLYKNGDESLKPTIITVNSLMSSFAKADKSDKAEKLLDELLPSSSSTGRDLPPPNTRTFNIAISSCRRRGNIQQASRIFERMKRASIPPNIITYNTMLTCLANNGSPKAAKHAKELFATMVNDDKLEPNRISLSALLQTLVNAGDVAQAEQVLLALCSKSGNRRSIEIDTDLFHYVLGGYITQRSPKHAEALLLKMIQAYERGLEKVKPIVDTYNRVLSCWASSDEADRGERAELILREMQSIHAKGNKGVSPDIISYNCVVNAWANSDSPMAIPNIENIILELIMKGRKDLMPDNITYSAWFKAIAKLPSPEERKRQVEAAMKMMKIHEFKPTDSMQKQVAKLLS